MQKKILLGISTIALVLSSCSEDWETIPSDGKGYISPIVDIDTRTISSRSIDTRSDLSDLRVEDLTLTLTKNDGTYSWSGNVSDFPKGPFSVGTYLLETSYGDANEEGFEKPALYGSQSLTVSDEKTTEVSITAAPSNAQIRIEYSDAFKNYMADWNATVNGVFYEKEETRPVFVKPGDATIKISVTKPNGVSADFTMDKVTAKARYVYVINVNVNQNSIGDATLEVTFDENFQTDDIEIDLSDKLLSAPAPEIDTDGFILGEPIELIAGLTKGSDVTMSLIAMAGLKEVNLETSSSYLLSQGWPESINLMGEDVPQSLFKEFGLDVLGLWKNPGEMAFLNFTDLLKNIKITNTSNQSEKTTFTLTVKDKLMRESDQVVLEVQVKPVVIELVSAGYYYSPGDPLKIGLKFNGTLENLKNGEVSFEYQDDYGRFRTISFDKESITEEDDYFVIPVILPSTFNDDVKMIAKCAGVTSEEFTFGASPFQVEVNENNVFSNYVFVKIIVTDDKYDISGKTPEFQIKGGSFTDFTKVDSAQEGDYYKLTGLPSGMSCQVRLSMDDMNSKSTYFTTETESVVPNGDFEALEGEKVYAIQQGGLWTGKTGILGSTTATVSNDVELKIQNANYWISSNLVTLEDTEITNNTWFKIPSVFNSCLSYISTQGTVSHSALTTIGGGKDTPSSYKINPINGSNSMVIRNVGWSLLGDVDALEDPDTKTNTQNCYSSISPDISTLDKKVGKLYLGSILSNGTAEEGIPFNSRPKKLTGSYTYSLDKDSQDANENGIINLELLDASGNTIASGNKDLKSGDTTFSLELSYVANPRKASKLKISIASSNYKDNDTDLNLTKYNGIYEAYYHGATLVIDDLTFEY